MVFTDRQFKECLGCFATGVTIATTRTSQGAAHGVTINSFNSVSLHPPLVLFSLDTSCQSFPIFMQAPYFAINILTSEQAELSRRFSLHPADPWEGVAFRQGMKGSPILEGVLGYIECGKESVHEGGDHIILVGRVLHLQQLAAGKKPLIYYRGCYGGFSQGEAG